MSRAANPERREPPVLLFDGVCNLCNGAVTFVIRRDPPPAKFRFAPLQSEFGQRVLREHGLSEKPLDTFVMLEDGAVHVRSTAALKTLKRLGLPWSLAYAAIVVPAPLRDAFYRFVARNRYRWFGKRDACMLPTPELRSRFLS
jgi:predicted DCC family thiol-disulfide oxidoreductase YuxK